MLEQAIVCTICSKFLAKERPQWVWFAGLAVLAGVVGLLTPGVVHAQQLARRA
jgi:drug/metabolite transporter (DMT)-like permease